MIRTRQLYPTDLQAISSSCSVAGTMNLGKGSGAESPFSAVVVAGSHSGVGKTSIALGLIGALRRDGYIVQPFKVGPDFIDPLHHQQASGRESRNLDGWMLDAEENRQIFARASADADVAIIEGVMGLFDGSEGKSDRGSTAEMAKILGAPVILVIDASAMARSAGALIHGFARFDPETRVSGVILNNVGGSVHADMIREAVDDSIPVLGAIPHVPELALKERHLGLSLPNEAPVDYIADLATLIADHVDVGALMEAGLLERPAHPARRRPPTNHPRVRIGVARDEAFCFYYADNLELLEASGAELVQFSPLRDPLPAQLGGLYIGGGYPELHASVLAENDGVLKSIRDFAAAGGPIYAECGGLMYLARTLQLDGQSFPLCGVFPFSTRMPGGLTMSYVQIETTGGLFGAGHSARGHLFHHSEMTGEPPAARCFDVSTTRGAASKEGYQVNNALASYIHLHFASRPQIPEAFVARCRAYQAG